jgi:type I restriction enzyme S subunit
MSEWKEYKLGDIVSFSSGGTPSKSNEAFWGGNIPWISASSMEGYTYSDSTLRITELGLKNGTRLAPKNSILLLVRGSILHQKLQVGIVERDVSFNQDVKCLQPNEEIIDSWFLLFWFKSEEKNLLNKVESTGIGAGKLDTSVLKELLIKVPPIHERIKLNEIFKSIQGKIELNRQLNQTLDSMAQALFKSWFIDFDPVMDNALAEGNDIPDELQAMAEKRQLVPNPKKLLHSNPSLAAQFPSDFVFNEVLGRWIPDGWEVKSFGNFIETTIGGDWGKEVPDEKHTEKVKIIRGTDIPSLANCNLDSVPTRFVELKKLKARKLEVGDIVIEVSGGSPTQSTGRSIRLTKNILERLGNIAEPASFCRRLKPINEHFSVLCGEHLTYIYGIGKMWEYQNQSTGIANFQTPFFLEAEMVLIPSNEGILNSFYSQVSKLRDKASSNENIILAQLRDRLLPELISGRVRITNFKQKKDEKTLQQNYF